MHTSITSNFDLPQELCVKPFALVGVSGLDIANNSVHKLIWELLNTNRRVERAAILFKLIEGTHEFPVIKPKRNSYDWYNPKGILKKNWMNKHLYQIPAVVVVFYDLNWNDPLWNEKMLECSAKVQLLRTALEGRNSRLVVVLIQNSDSSAAEDPLASERAVSICASCELNAQSLFVLPHGDHLQGYLVRLETAFYDFAQNYYHNEAKLVRSHKDHLNKSTHQYLYVRHQFKLGFLFELKQDLINAQKHYNHAYNNLLEIRIVDTNALEIRLIAGFINYKLCKLLFALTLPRDSISQFRNHIDRFKPRLGFQELAFEHYAWLSKQYAVFGDIFDETVKAGLPAVQTQHPGIYYQQAAQYAIARKNICKELCSSVTHYPQPDPLENFPHMEYYGQRPWRPLKVSHDVQDPQVESNGIQALQFLEKQVNHSNIIITLFGLAISQFKTYRCPRMRKHLVLQMADEYFNSQDYGKALTLLTHMLWDFRLERWWLLMSDILVKTLQCAFLEANINDYLLSSLELLGENSEITIDHKKKIYENFLRVLKKEIPFGDPNLSQDMLQKAIIKWQPVVSMPNTNKHLYFSIDLNNVICCIETKARFVKKFYEIDQKVEVEIFLRNTSPFVMDIFGISVTISAPGINTTEYSVKKTNNLENFTLKSNEVKKFIVEYFPDTNNLLKEIQIGTINIQLGSADFIAELKFPSKHTLSSIPPELTHFKYCKEKLDFENLDSLPITTIVPRSSNLQISFKHAQPALLGEWYKIFVYIENKESFILDNLEISVSIIEEENPITTEISTTEIGKIESFPAKLCCIKTLEKNENTTTYFLLRCHKIGVKNLQIKINYLLNNENEKTISTKTESLLIPVVQPFEVNFKFVSKMMLDINKFYVNEDFGMIPTIVSTSPYPICIKNTSINFSPNVNSLETDSESPLWETILEEKEAGAELFLLSCDKASENNISIGQYVIQWKRNDGENLTTTIVPITGYHCVKVPLKLYLSHPSHGIVRTPLLVKYNLENTSHQILQLEINVEASEGFMFSGYKRFTIDILPQSVRSLQYNLYPLFAGNVALPKINFLPMGNSPENELLTTDELQSMIFRSLPTHLFIIPKGKTESNHKTLSQVT